MVLCIVICLLLCSPLKATTMLPRLISSRAMRGATPLFPMCAIRFYGPMYASPVLHCSTAVPTPAVLGGDDDGDDFNLDIEALGDAPPGDVMEGLAAAPDTGGEQAPATPAADAGDDITIEESVRMAEEVAAITRKQDAALKVDVFDKAPRSNKEGSIDTRLGATPSHYAPAQYRVRKRPLCRGFVARWDFEKSYAVVVDADEIPFYPERSYVLFPSSIRFNSNDIPPANQTLKVFQALEFDKLTLERSKRSVAINACGHNGAPLPPGPTSEIERKVTSQDASMSLADTAEANSVDTLPEDSIFRRDNEGEGIVTSPTSTIGKSPPASFRKDFYRPRSILAGQDEEVEHNPTLEVGGDNADGAPSEAFTLNDFGIEVNESKGEKPVDRTNRSSYFATIDTSKKSLSSAASRKRKVNAAAPTPKKDGFLNSEFGEALGSTTFE